MALYEHTHTHTHSPDDDDLKATYLWMGERWLSGPFSPSPMCTSDCLPATGVCARDPRFRKGHEFTYWSPLEFDDSHAVKMFKAFQNEVTVEVNV